MLHPETRIMSQGLLPLCTASVVVAGVAVVVTEGAGLLGAAVEAEKSRCFLVDNFQIGFEKGVVGEGTGAGVVGVFVTWDATLGVTWKPKSGGGDEFPGR